MNGEFWVILFLRAIDFLGGVLGIAIMTFGIPLIGWLVTP